MSEGKRAPGFFIWTELGTTDEAGAKRFYRELFGWDMQSEPMEGGGSYTRLFLGGRLVGGLYELTPEMRQQGVPPHWMPYVRVSDTDAVARRAAALGGAVAKDAFDAADAGRMAVLKDPTGAVFCVWQAKRELGADVFGEPGSLCWTELMTTDAERARRFYAELFAWKPEASDIPGMPYTVFRLGDEHVCGMMEMSAQESATIPPHWMSYFAVADCDASADRARALGATVVEGPTDVPRVGRWALLRDPQGAHVAIIQLAR